MNKWTLDDIDFLLKNYKKMSNYDISKVLNKSKKSVDSKAIRLNLKKDPNYISVINRERVKSNRWMDSSWTKEQIDFVINNINLISNEEISKQVNKTKNAVVSICQRIGLKRESKYNKQYIEKECLKYITKSELRISDPNLYAWLYRHKEIKNVTGHMFEISYSTPQLILNYILSSIFSDNSIYNDRSIIKPYEIDIFFPKNNIGFEYDGKYHHPHGSDLKENLCNQKGINLITINEDHLTKRNFNGYVSNIKNQLIEKIDVLNIAFNKKTSKEDILNLTINSGEVFKKLIDVKKMRDICNRYTDYTKFIREQKSVYQKLYYMGILDEFTKHMKVKQDMEFIIEISSFFKVDDLVLIEYWYNSMICVVKILDRIGNKYLVSHNNKYSKIQNAPNELISKKDIIDKYKNYNK